MNKTPYWSDRILNLPPYVFSELDRLKTDMKKAGKDLIDLSIGDPDLPTPKALIDKCYEEMQKPENHRYPSYAGHPVLRQAIARMAMVLASMSTTMTRLALSSGT